ncbi:hypothetical protein Ancab_023268 [Ancistrocladus abbreviatus]
MLMGLAMLRVGFRMERFLHALCARPVSQALEKWVDTDCLDQKIYSQTIPCASTAEDIVILPVVNLIILAPRWKSHQLVVIAILWSLKIFSSTATYARFSVSIRTASILLYFHGYVLAARITQCFIGISGSSFSLSHYEVA